MNNTEDFLSKELQDDELIVVDGGIDSSLMGGIGCGAGCNADGKFCGLWCHLTLDPDK